MPRTHLLVPVVVALVDLAAFGQCGGLPGDSNGNQHVELLDHSNLVKCLAGPAQPPQPPSPQTQESCLAHFDADGDFDVDLQDFAEFLVTFTGSFRPECFNIVFVSSVEFPTNLGSAAAYDNQCNVLASAAGLNNPAGNAFIAWISSTSSTARSRLGPARGFVRPDGLPVADDLNDLFTNHSLLNPIRVDEYGNDAGSALVMTGTMPDGTTSVSTCANWTSTTGQFQGGNSAWGPVYWTHGNFTSCTSAYRIYCFQKNIIRFLIPPISPGRLIYLTNTPFTPGGGLAAADQLCTSEKPPGTGTVRALLATTTASAASRFNPVVTFVRVDGQVVGTVSELVSAGFLRSGVWQLANGTYAQPQYIRTGSSGFATIGTAASTCNNWTSTSGAGSSGLSFTTKAPDWWFFFSNQGCNTAQRIYCAEQ